MKRYGAYSTAVIGLVLLGVGIYLVKTAVLPSGVLKTLPFILLGLGCGAFGHGAGDIVSMMAVKKHPELQKQIEIDTHDERNVAIANRAKAKAYDMMVFAFGALMLTFALMNVDLTAILLLVFTYLLVVGYGVYYRCKYDKEM